MNPERFVETLTERFARQPIDLANEERGLRIQIADALLDVGCKVFSEYPYASTKALCDLAITQKDDYRIVTDWIEIKPILDGWNYWNPAKMLNEEPFLKDIQKLREIRTGEKWFLVVMECSDEMIGDDIGVQSVKGKRLSPPQIRAQIDKWADSKPSVVKPLKVGGNYCHIFLWKIQATAA